MTFFDRKIKIVAMILLLGVGVYVYSKYDLKSYIIVDPKTVKPVGEINFSFNDSYQDTWNKSTTYPYKALMLHGYDLCLMSELPKSKEPLNRRIYIEKETAKKGLTAYENWITINTSMLRPTKFIINNGEITIPYAEQIHIKYYGQSGKEFRSLRIRLINRRGASLEEVIPQLKELIKSIDAAGWQRSPGYEHIIGKLDDKLMAIRLFDIPTPRNVDFMRWTKGEYILAVDGYAKIAHYPKEKNHIG